MCHCTLEEFFFGSTKTVFFTRQQVCGDGFTTVNDGDHKEIEVKPGMKDGQVFKFEGEGNQAIDKLKGDLFITLKQHPHERFRRVGDNLVYRHKISLKDALLASPVEFKTIDDQIVKFAPDEIINAETTKVFEGLGMPILNDDPLSAVMHTHSHGDLILKFAIEFPNHLTQDKKRRLLQVLQ